MKGLVKLAAIAVIGSAYLIFRFFQIKVWNNPAELDLNSVLSVSLFLFAFSVAVLVFAIKGKKDNQN